MLRNILLFILFFTSSYLAVSFLFDFETLTRQTIAQHITSPLPDYFENVHMVKTLDIWKPKETYVLASNSKKPEINALSAYMYDITSDKVLFEKNAKMKLPIASLVKIATAIVALESANPQKEITISSLAAETGENTMGLTAGEVYTLEELLYGLVLHSGNDAAVAIAEGTYGTPNKFVDAMNDKAKILGLTNTHFVNPNGLEEDDPNMREYSTAVDLTILTKYALTNPTFAKVAETVDYHMPYASTHKEIYLSNQTNLLTTYPGVKGVKTGYTPSAGLCLVTYAENGGHKLIGVVLNSQSRREDMRAMLDYSFDVLGVKLQ